MVTRDEVERTILEIVWAENFSGEYPTMESRVALVKSLRVQADWFTTVDRRLLWLIAGAATSREHAIQMLDMAITARDIGPTSEHMPRAWFWSEGMLRYSIRQLCGFKMKAGIR